MNRLRKQKRGSERFWFPAVCGETACPLNWAKKRCYAAALLRG